MAATTRSRAFPPLTMPGDSTDRSQQAVGFAFPGSNLFPNHSIWTSSLASAGERSIGSSSKDSDNSPSGSSALNPGSSDADGWSSNPWNTEHPGRSVSTSPSRTRDAAGPGYFDHVSLSNGAHSAATTFSSQRRTGLEAPGYPDSMAVFSHHRDSSLPTSRHSQTSPAVQDLYRAGHTPSNSVHSQRPPMMTHASSSFSSQNANQRAFNTNQHLDDDLSAQLSRRLALESPSSATSFSQSSQPFQLNPGSQPWMGEGGAMRYAANLDSPVDSLGSHYATVRRSPAERLSPASSYRLETSSAAQGFGQAGNMWSSRPAARNPRPSEMERRNTSQQMHATNGNASFFQAQFPYAALAQQGSGAGYADPYSQAFRQIPMLSGYTLHAMQAGYPLATAFGPGTVSSREQDSGKGVRNSLLEEFRLSSKSSKRYELKDIYSYMVEFSGDQHGSRFIQQKLETANSEEKEQVFREIEPNAIQLMKDVFGNYVVQKFFEHGNQVQKKVLAEKMKGKVVDLSMQVYACRVVQKALEHVLVEQQAELTKELEPEILKVTRDQNGNHVVQKIIELVPRCYIGFIMNALRGQVTGLASHAYGCRVVQRMLEHGTESDKEDMMTELHASAQILITDQYGNYVAQHVIQNGKEVDRQRMIRLVMSQLLTLSKHKFASNVVEKCIEYGTDEQRSMVRAQLTMVGSDGTNTLQQMMRDQYGNYVIQKLLAQLEGAERESLVEEIKPQFFALKKNTSSRQVQALEKLLGVQTGVAASKATAAATPAVNTAVSSTMGTPQLTHDPSSPESCSPPSTTRLSPNGGFPAGDADKKAVPRRALKVRGVY